MFDTVLIHRLKKRSKGLANRRMLTAVALALPMVGSVAHAYDVSPPAILQDFEDTYQTMQNRMPDFFAAGYGAIYTPPPGRAESGNQSVGYDAYDRFDLGSAGNPTLYGTENGLKQVVNSIHQIGASAYVDLVWNQSGFADTGTSGFAQAGGYPGFALTLQTSNPNAPGYNTAGYNVTDGDYHSAYATGDQDERLAGLVDIAQESNNVFIRQPTTAGSDNIPGPVPGATPWFYTGLANVPNPNNAQYYPDTSLNPISVYNPATGQGNIKIYPYNLANPMAGDPVPENALGYLMRNAQWLVQTIGVDGFRVDAAKNFPTWVLGYLDQAVYRSSFRTLLNGQQENIFSFSEVYDGSSSDLQPYILKNINPSDPGTIGGNRDVLDFPLFFAMQQNLSGNGYQNDFRNMMNASVDTNDDGLMNGSQGVKFVSSQDNQGAYLDNVAYAFTLMTPGNAIVYDNGHEFGTGRSFPQPGRSDALGGMYGDTITTLVDLRNRYGRGNYIPETIDASDGNGYQYEQNQFAFERQGSCLVLLSNRTDAGYDTRTVHTDFPGGTYLLEQTGNAAAAGTDSNGNSYIPQLLQVNSDGTVNVHFLRNSSPSTGNFTGDGYLVYGLPTPQGSMNISNVAKVLHNAVPTATGTADQIAYANATTRIADVDVVAASNFQIQLNTLEVNLLGSIRDHNADGDNAEFEVDDGSISLNGDGHLDDTNPGDVSYGYQTFNTLNSPGYSANGGAGGNGAYAQTINTSQLSQGYHYIRVIAFRHNDNTSAPPVYTDWTQTIYVDTVKANSTVLSFSDAVSGVNENRNLQVSSVDGLANNVHTFLDLPANLTDAQVLAMIGSGSQTNQLDTTLWQHYYSGVTSGNHTVTVVTLKPDYDGTASEPATSYSIQRYDSQQDPFLSTSTLYGAGLGDVNFDGSFNSNDISAFIPIVESNNTQFNAAADINGDGVVDLADAFLLGPVLNSHNVDQNTWNAYNGFINSTFVTTGTYNVVGTNVIYQDTAGTTHVTSNGNLNATYIRGNALNIDAGGKATIAFATTAMAGASKVSSLTIAGTTGAWTGKLDLTNNSMIVESTSANAQADLARITNMVKTAYDNGAWDGMGITSSTAATNPLYTIGTILNTGPFGVIHSIFEGIPADGNAILLKYTYYGDANLDGRVNGTDYSLIDTGYASQSTSNPLTGWVNGDFNYDGVIDGSDYSLIDNAFNNQGAQQQAEIAQTLADVAVPTSEIAGSGSSVSIGAASVPEPTGMTLIGAAGAALLARRRRK
jgi:alpha-amylase